MFGMGGSEILVILIVALLFLGPDKLPEAAKKISKGIRDIKRQSRVLQRTIEDDEHIGGAIRDLKSALRGEEEPVRPPPPKPKKQLMETPGEPPALLEPGAPEHAAVPDSPIHAADGLHEAGAPSPHGAAGDISAGPVTDAPDRPERLTMPATAGEPEAGLPATTAQDDTELAALVRPAPNTIARSTPAPAAPPSEPAADPDAPAAASGSTTPGTTTPGTTIDQAESKHG